MAAAAAAVAAAAMTGGRHRTASMKQLATKNLETNIDRASGYIQTGDINEPEVYSHTCMKLGSSIDSAIAMNAFLSSFHLLKLTLIVKEVYRRNIKELQPSLMLLMLPIKAACKIGWFPDADKDGLLLMAKEVSFGFCNTDKMNIEPSNAHENVLNIVSRFYPTMKVEHILTSFDVEAGYGTFVADFHISIGTTPRQCRDLWLLLAKLENMDTAACITGPSDVDFLLNGSVVPNRTKKDMEKGPLLPLKITKKIHYGLNLLQVFGDFDGQYIIALAFMNPIPPPDPSQLQDYLHPVYGGVDSDCEVIEMTSSQISLCCPASQHRIKTPVKGHLCKHSQCFDYNYFIEVNSTKPTWTCPICNNPVCNQDIRVDQVFLKILNEVAKDVNDVILSENGSWTVAETNMDTMSYTTITAPAASPGQTQVNVCPTNQAQTATFFTSPITATTPAVSPGSLGQSQVYVCTTNQGQSAPMFTLPATDTKPVLSPGQTQVNVCTTNQAQSATKFTPPATETKPSLSPGQTQVNVCTAKQALSTPVFKPPIGSPGLSQVNVCTANQGQTTPMFKAPETVTKPVLSPGQTQVNVCTTNQAQSATKFTPPATETKPSLSPGQTQVNVCTAKQALSTPGFTPPAGSPGLSQVNVCTANQGHSAPMFRAPATVTKPAISPGQTQVNAGTATQAISTSMFTPPPPSNQLRKGVKQGESQSAPNISHVFSTQPPEASVDTMPAGRMRGSLRGDQLEAARLQYLSPPVQPARANEPWSRPPIPSLPSPFLMPRTPANSDNL